MPGRDGSGPRGQGPMTGGGRGCCAGISTRGFFGGFGCGFGRGGGRGFGNRFRYVSASNPAETNNMENEAAFLRERLAALEAQLETQRKASE